MSQRLLACFLVGSVISVCSLTEARAQNSNYQKLSNGVLVSVQKTSVLKPKVVKLEVINDKIIHVIASPQNELPTQKSLMAITQPAATANWSVVQSGDVITVKTAELNALVSATTGVVSFTDKNGKQILNEVAEGGKTFTPATYTGEATYQLRQAFESGADEAYYGLGQHQEDLMNYKNRHVDLYQYNTKVAIPFVVSNKNYGILWDNYSLTAVGDTRNFQPLSALKLYDDKGNVGWLTATYGSKSNAGSTKSIVRAESEIDYSFLKDQHKFPQGYNLADGLVQWTGSIESSYTGLHQFQVKYAGYMKIWVDGKLLADKWRQAWNPGSSLADVQMVKGKKYSIKIEWLPDGTESYLAVNWLSPVPEAEKNTFAFASEAGDAIDYYFISGKNADEVISGYRTITGKANILPKWAMGFWQSRERYKTQDEILNTVKEFRSRKIPIDGIVLDWSYWKQDDWGSHEFDASRFSNPAEMISTLHDKYHTRFMISVWPKFYEGVANYNYMNENGWLYKRNIADQRRDWIGKGYTSTFYDALNPDARKGFWNLLNKNLYSKGVDGWWMDAAEPDVHSNLDIPARQSVMTPTAIGSGVKYFNAFPFGNAMGIYEGQREVNPNDRVIILTRSAHAGQQRFSTIVWSGDIASRWEDFKTQIPAGINFSLSGIPYWSMDAGGFSVERRYEHAQGADLDEWRELNTRWYQFAAFVPVFRVHGQFPFREIYNIAPENHAAYKSMMYYNKLRYRLMPYIYSLAGQAYHNDYTIMRGLVMDFAADPAVNNIADEYMFGPSLLINPVYNYHAINRSVYLPKGSGWYNFYTGAYSNGGQTLTADAPYERIPVYVKEGSIIPFGPELQYTSEKPAEQLTLYVYTGSNGKFNLYEDEGSNYNYEKGAFSTISFKYNEQNRTLSIGERKGSFNGMLAKRTFKIVWMNKNKAKAFDLNQKADKTVTYEGKPILITQ
ncbi:alpha-xylosidase [Solitalea longa]|uniref:Alpha-xylosidase n=1 Tax=Solitalea longa TaxID=2079460 RepID=A0A2S5A4K3_9SPHI|nr:TIM-barrel domain-containing protein [Solitalea longa]POY37466.1 alpha-xylosidase [Solitalea longa]